MRRRAVQAGVVLIYLFATLQFVRYYARSTVFYLNLQAYLSGHERLPFQERILPAFILRPMYESHLVTSHFHSDGIFTAERGPFYVLSLVALIVAGIYTQRLYEQFTATGALRLLVFPLFLYTMVWTYCIHSEANFSYPYDFPAVAFFAAGLFYIARRSFWGLLFVVLLGTLNRETTLFLIGIFVLDAITVPASAGGLLHTPGFHSLDLRRIPWAKTALLAVVWISTRLLLHHLFAANDASESFLRVHDNLLQLRPRLLPALLNICGYTLPLILLFRQYLPSTRFRNYLYILPLWFGIMFATGILVETRIYGELCSYCAVAVVLILETHAQANALAPQNQTVSTEARTVRDQEVLSS